MKAVIGFTSALLLAAGCATNETGRVTYDSGGQKTYGLDDQPQEAITGDGSLMPGAYGQGTPRTGQFSGLERSQAQVGQYPVPPRETDLREYERERKQVGTGIVEPALGAGAGSLGQSGIVPGRSSVSASTLGNSPANPTLAPGQPAATVNPPVASQTPTLAQPLTTPQNNIDTTTGVGRGPSTETGVSTSSIDSPLDVSPGGSPPTLSGIPAPGTGIDPAASSLGERVRQSLLPSNPASLANQGPDRLELLDVEDANGNITLRGNVRSEAEKVLLGQRAGRMDGVRSVNNQLRVISPTREGMQDATDPAARVSPLAPEK